LEQFLAVAQSGIPVFIDKPLTVCYQDALRLAEKAEQLGVPVMSSSALRFADGVVRTLNGCGNVIGVDCFGPMLMEQTQPGYFWYGIHTAEMLYRMMGTGCKSIHVTVEGISHLLTGVWKDGRIGTIRGIQMGSQGFGAAVHTESGVRFVDVNADQKPFYASLMDNVMDFFQTGQSAVPLAETLEIIRFVEAANESAATGRTVLL
jgi:predicted dehydrogenase